MSKTWSELGDMVSQLNTSQEFVAREISMLGLRYYHYMDNLFI
jgi:hypothetical protein